MMPERRRFLLQLGVLPRFLVTSQKLRTLFLFVPVPVSLPEHPTFSGAGTLTGTGLKAWARIHFPRTFGEVTEITGNPSYPLQKIEIHGSWENMHKTHWILRENRLDTKLKE